MAKARKSEPRRKVFNTIEPSRCPKCKSTQRTAYDKRRAKKISGEHNGEPFNEIIYRPTQCLDCGQWRTDRTFSYALEKQVKQAAETTS